ncbi:MAG: FAD-dependent oxidoreductase [Alphaproteobacteria bacterium]|nr:FAD-dependent oxidoreductase [Alphaproteobacteria bacterium]
MTLPSHARAVVIGGGIVGCSTAYHLGKLGWKDVVLLERKKLTSGTTFHAAGLVGQLRSSANITRLLTHSVELYERLEAETGLSSGFKRTGGLRLACSADRFLELRRQATMATSFGLDVQVLSAKEALALWPAMAVDDVVGAVFLPSDGQANPSDIAMALAKGARLNRVRIVEDCPVTAIRVKDGRVAGVATAGGEIACDVVVNCAGQWAKEVGRMAGVSVPLQSVQHQYLITESIPGLPRHLPTMRDPDNLIYFKEEVGGLAMGGYEPNPIPWALDGIPEGFHFSLLESDWDHFEPMMAPAIRRVPALEKAGVKQLVNGPESFTPDGNFILGEAPGLRGFFVACGFNAFGIAGGGGAGKAIAEWVAGGEAPMDLWPVDIRRFGAVHRDDRWVRERTLEAYAKHYTIAWPNEEYKAARGPHRSPLYDRLALAGACFGSKFGWERPNWFAPPGVDPVDQPSFGRANWFDAVAAEHRACREAAVLFDQTSFAKAEVVGRDAERALQWIAANDVARPVGQVIYTQLLNRHGGIEADLTLWRRAPDAYYVVTGTAFATRDFDWIARNIPSGMHAAVRDVTHENAVLALMGPRAREVLAAVTNDDVSNAALPYMTGRAIAIAGQRVAALRVTYVGELGYELHVPMPAAAAVYDALKAAGAPLALRDAGYRAIESLRLEKGYRAWGGEIGPDFTPLEAGLGFAVKLGTDIAFQGREALLQQKKDGLRRRLVGVTASPDVFLHGRETIYRDGVRAGWLASGGFGHTVGRAIGYGYARNDAGVDAAYLRTGTWELEVARERVSCEVHLQPLYDPKGERVRS